MISSRSLRVRPCCSMRNLVRSRQAHVGEDIGLSEILAGLQIQVIYRESTGNRVFPFFAPTPPGWGSAGAAARAPLIEIAALSGLALFCQFCHAAGPTSTSPACIEITAFFQLVS